MSTERPFSFKREGDTVTIVMSLATYERLLIGMGFKMGMAKMACDEPLFRFLVELANDLNADNPQYTPYEVPKDPHVQ